MTFRKELVLLALIAGTVLTFAQPGDRAERRAALEAPIVSATR